MNKYQVLGAAPQSRASLLLLAILLQVGSMTFALPSWSQALPLTSRQIEQGISASLPGLTKSVIEVVGSENGTVSVTSGTYQLVVTVLNSTLKTPLEREAEAARIAAVLSKAIAAKPEFKRLQAYHIDYVTNSGDHDDAHFVDGIDFRKNPEGKFLHHKS